MNLKLLPSEFPHRRALAGIGLIHIGPSVRAVMFLHPIPVIQLLLHLKVPNILRRVSIAPSSRHDAQPMTSGSRKMLRRFGVPYGSRTRVAAVKGRCPRPLDERDAYCEKSFLAASRVTYRRHLRVSNRRHLQVSNEFSNGYCSADSTSH
jgi:hypothetical protein